MQIIHSLHLLAYAMSAIGTNTPGGTSIARVSDLISSSMPPKFPEYISSHSNDGVWPSKGGQGSEAMSKPSTSSSSIATSPTVDQSSLASSSSSHSLAFPHSLFTDSKPSSRSFVAQSIYSSILFTTSITELLPTVQAPSTSSSSVVSGRKTSSDSKSESSVTSVTPYHTLSTRSSQLSTKRTPRSTCSEERPQLTASSIPEGRTSHPQTQSDIPDFEHLPLQPSTKVMSDGATSVVMVSAPPPVITSSTPRPPTGTEWRKIEIPIGVEIDFITYILPVRGSRTIDHISQDNKAQLIEISLSEIKITNEGDIKSTTTWRVPSDVGNEGISIQPKTGSGVALQVSRGPRSQKKHKSLLDAFKYLTNSAGEALKSVTSVTETTSKFINAGFAGADDVLDSLSSTITKASGIMEDTTGMASDFGIELSEFGTSGTGNMPAVGAKVFDAYESASGILDLLRPLEKITRTLRSSPGFNGPGGDIAKLLFRKLTSQSGAAGVVPLTVTSSTMIPLAVIRYDDKGPLSGSLSSFDATQSSATKGDESKSRKQYYIETYQGTSFAVYRAFLATLPDTIQWTIDQSEYPWMDWQILGIKLAADEAKIVQALPIIETCHVSEQSGKITRSLNPFRDSGSHLSFKAHPASSSRNLRLRDIDQPSSDARFITRKDAPGHLQLLSQTKKNIFGKPGYLYNEKLGEGTTVYIFDTGFDSTHPELAQGERLEKPQFWTVPNKYTLNDPTFDSQYFAPEDITDYEMPSKTPDKDGNVGYGGHGTQVASAAVGLTRGVAPKANLIGIKITNAMMFNYKNDHYFPDGQHYENRRMFAKAVAKGFQMAINDVRKHNRQGKAVFSVSWLVEDAPDSRSEEPIPQADIDDISMFFKKIMPTLDSLGIVFTICGGNDARDARRSTINNQIPASLETWDSPLLVVGGVDYKGRVIGAFSVADPQFDDPQIRIYAQGSKVNVGWSHRAFDGTRKNGYSDKDGTSFSTPQIAGLVAYYMSTYSAPGVFATGTEWKQLVVDFGHEIHPPMEYLTGTQYFSKGYYKEPIKVGYNWAPDEICTSQGSTPKPPRSSNIPIDAEIIIQNGKVSNADAVDWDGLLCNDFPVSSLTMSSMSMRPTKSSSWTQKSSSTVTATSNTVSPSPINACHRKTPCPVSVDVNRVYSLTGDLCRNSLPPGRMLDINFAGVSRDFTDLNTGAKYHVSASWIPGCTVERQHVMGDAKLCATDVLAAFCTCATNDGAGGLHISGCVQFDSKFECS